MEEGRKMVKMMMMLALVGLACSAGMGRPSGGARSFLCRGSGVTQMPSDIPRNTTDLEVTQTQLKVIPHAAFTRLKELQKLVISENGALESIEALAFADLPALTHITISKCKYLVVVHKDAFVDLPMLQYLIISNTGLRALPDFSQIHSNALEFLLDMQENYIERIPSNAFSGLCTGTISEMRLIKNGIREVESNAFNGTAMKRLFLTGNQQLTRLHSNAFAGSSELLSLDISHTALSSLPVSILGQLLRLTAVSVHALRELPPVRLFGRLKHANLTYPSHCCAFHNARRNRSQASALCSKPKARENQPFYGDHCATSVACSPAPDAFNPCEDVMGCSFLQVLIWVISILALLGNAAVLLVLLGSRAKLTVPHFLMCHLAFAGLCMGIYLVIIAAVDMRTRGRYYNHAIDWQRGPGCKAAGFFTVFASELSVFTLTAITLERWHTITHALRLDHKLRLRHACVVMSGGWAFSCLAALLPTIGVSSYSKVSICLPMDVESLQSQIYLVFLLLLNVLAFVCVCACYLSIYLTVRNPSSAPARADTRVAQRMAVLIFTDFLCMAPISFFAISAALKLPLITVSHAKLLLVFFYPINSCANPFLYAFFTRTFRRDFFMLAARFGVCTTRAQIYRTESSSAQQAAWIPSPKTSLGTLYSLGSLSQHSHCPLTLYPSGSGRSSPPPS